MKWKEVIKKRISHFQSIYHAHEAGRLTLALKAIDELVPPSEFDASHPSAVQAEALSVRKFMLKKFPTNKYMDCPIPKHHWETIQEYAEAYHASLSAPQDEGWVSVEDRLPEHDKNRDSEWCNVCIDGKFSHIPAWHKGENEDYTGRWFQLGIPYAVKNITHWRKLPSPPNS